MYEYQDVHFMSLLSIFCTYIYLRLQVHHVVELVFNLHTTLISPRCNVPPRNVRLFRGMLHGGWMNERAPDVCMHTIFCLRGVESTGEESIVDLVSAATGV